MSDLKRHNVFGIDHTKPDWVNPDGNKWWGLDVGDIQDGQPAYVEFRWGEKFYVILDKNGVFYETQSFEALAGKMEQLRIIREMA